MFRYTHVDREGNLLCDVARYVKKHNVIYKTPPKKPQEGLPLGNGAMGGMVYHSDREHCMRINPTDKRLAQEGYYSILNRYESLHLCD